MLAQGIQERTQPRTHGSTAAAATTATTAAASGINSASSLSMQAQINDVKKNVLDLILSKNLEGLKTYVDQNKIDLKSLNIFSELIQRRLDLTFLPTIKYLVEQGSPKIIAHVSQPALWA